MQLKKILLENRDTILLKGKPTSLGCANVIFMPKIVFAANFGPFPKEFIPTEQQILNVQQKQIIAVNDNDEVNVCKFPGSWIVTKLSLA